MGIALSLLIFMGSRKSDRLCLSEKLGDEALGILVRSGLEKRFPDKCVEWTRDSNALRNISERRANTEIANVMARLRMELPALRRSLFEAVLDEVLRLYP